MELVVGEGIQGRCMQGANLLLLTGVPTWHLVMEGGVAVPLMMSAASFGGRASTKGRSSISLMLLYICSRQPKRPPQSCTCTLLSVCNEHVYCRRFLFFAGHN